MKDRRLTTYVILWASLEETQFYPWSLLDTSTELEVERKVVALEFIMVHYYLHT